MALGILGLSITNTFLILAPAGADPDRLVMIHSRLPGEDIGQVSYPDYKYYRENKWRSAFVDRAGPSNDARDRTVRPISPGDV